MKDSDVTGRPVLSIVIPLYNEADNVETLVRRLEGVMGRLGCHWEFVFALDPSPDGTREKILELLRAGHPVRLITFSRRIGKPLSLLAGLEHCRGDACVIIDADLQDPPELIEEMYRKWQDGYEVVIPQRVSRKGENYLYLKAAETFYWLLDKIAEVRVPRNTGDFRLLDARVVREVCRFRERHGFLRGITAAAGFRTTVIPYHRDARLTGKTQIPLSGAINIALDGLVPFSRVPVRTIFVLGAALMALAAGTSLAWIALGLITGFSSSWPFMALAILMLLLSGIVLSGMGILGEYLVRAYEDSRDRPLYIVDAIEEADTLPRRIVNAELASPAVGREPSIHGQAADSAKGTPGR
ncbi:MAG: glycosyltransferase family 2 protein [Desulfomonile tiedjei]|nr:glycosyltransferase family 2 protein [Desulfomonile tiedjei]